MTLLSFSTLLGLGRGRASTVGTLGPEGTSSESAATVLAGRLNGGENTAVRLYDTYEAAGAALHEGEVTHLVVANAYTAVHHFYMDPELELTNVFVMDTPQYGIAQRRGREPLPTSPTIASHPSPVPIIAQLLPRELTSHEVVLTNSTSAAAQAVADGTVDLALTTAPAVELNDLEFITRTRPIRMVWSVFTKSAALAQTPRAA